MMRPLRPQSKPRTQTCENLFLDNTLHSYNRFIFINFLTLLILLQFYQTFNCFCALLPLSVDKCFYPPSAPESDVGAGSGVGPGSSSTTTGSSAPAPPSASDPISVSGDAAPESPVGSPSPVSGVGSVEVPLSGAGSVEVPAGSGSGSVGVAGVAPASFNNCCSSVSVTQTSPTQSLSVCTSSEVKRVAKPATISLRLTNSV